MRVSPHFNLDEFMHPSEYIRQGEDSIKLLHPQLIDSTEKLRVYLDLPMRINNWNSGGTFQNRGWRPQNSKVGAKKSLHKKGMAIDFDSPSTPMKELFVKVWDARDWIVQNTAFRIIESFDFTPGWIHLAIGDPSIKEIVVVKP